MNDILVSVIIPIYNVCQYLSEALDSVMRQTYPNLEILLIDDGSTDGSGRLCDCYAERDSRIRVIHQANRGLSAARNVGLDAMTGEVVAFLDPDDAYEADFIEKLLKAMLQQEVPLAICSYAICNEDGTIRHGKGNKNFWALKGKYDRKRALQAVASDAISLCVWNRLYRCHLWENIRFPEGRNYEDMEVAYQIIDQCDFVYLLDDTLYRNRKRPGSITKTYSMKNILDNLQAYSGVEEFIKERIPEVFTEKMLLRCLRSKLNRLMRIYVELPQIKCDEKRQIEDFLWNKIRETGMEIGIKNCKMRTRVGYRLVLFCPQFLKFIFVFYQPVRRFVWETFRR